MKKSYILAASFAVLGLGGCSDPYDPTLRADYIIHVVPSSQGMVALPPPCASWNTDIADPYDNQPMPQYGCANARNLALMVERPSDLVEGRPLGPARGVTEVGAIRRYDNNQPRGLITPDAEVSQVAATTAPSAASSMSGDSGGGTSGGGAAPAAAASSP